jgi:hypothetical protein
MNRQHTHINRDNYEIWFIDHLDGQLSAAENEMLQQFLLENTDLSIELENLSDVTLETPSLTEFPDKALLKKASAPFSELSTYDYQMVKAIEEGLPAPEQLNMSGSAAQRDWDLYQKTKLQAAAIAYPQKNSLKRKRMTFIPVAVRALAAAVLLLILFNVRDDMPGHDNNNHRTVAVGETTPAIEHTPLLSQPKIEPDRKLGTNNFISTQSLANSGSTTAEEESIELIPEIHIKRPAPLPAPKSGSLPTPPLPNSYEIGLQLMLPQYIENHQLMARLSNQPMPRMAEPSTKTLLNRTSDLIKQVTPFNLTYNRVYDEDGELVAINLSGDNFEVAQKIPKWWGAR